MRRILWAWPPMETTSPAALRTTVFIFTTRWDLSLSFLLFWKMLTPKNIPYITTPHPYITTPHPYITAPRPYIPTPHTCLATFCIVFTLFPFIPFILALVFFCAVDPRKSITCVRQHCKYLLKFFTFFTTCESKGQKINCALRIRWTAC